MKKNTKKISILLFLFLSTASYAEEKPIVPDRNMTYGAVDINGTVDKICTPGYSKSVRKVTVRTRGKVYAEYKVDPLRDYYEVDHLVSLELGGSNDIKNLWPQSYSIYPWNARLKDRLENRLHKLVCEGKLDLPTAQFEIATNWIQAYLKYIGNPL